MDDIKSWWGIAQLAGAGATLVLGPVAWLLWKRVSKDVDYIRDADKNMLTVLSELTKVIESITRDGETRHTQLMGAIGTAVQTIKEHVDARIKKEN